MRRQTWEDAIRRNRYEQIPTAGMATPQGPSTGPPAGPLPNRADRNILDRISRWQLWMIVWHATPLPWRLIAFPYGLIVYRRLFAASDTLRYLHAMHAKQYDSSRLFRLVRPRYRRVEQLLRRYGLGD